MPDEEQRQNRGLASRYGSVEIDWPKTIGYYGGVGLALAFELVEPPLAIFIAAVPILKMLNRPKAKFPVRLFSQLFEGAAKPVGGDAESTIRIVQAPQGESDQAG